MALIKLISEVKDVLRVSNMDDNASIPDMDAAGEKYILPAIGQELYDTLQEHYDAADLTTLQSKLLKKLQKPLAAFAYFDDLAAMHLRISDAGVRRTTTSNEPSAFRWEFEEAKEFLTNRGHQGIESLYAFLEKNKADIPEWTASDAYNRRNKFLIKSGTDFSDQFNLYQPLRTYNALFSQIAFVEDNFIYSSIGKDFFNYLKSISAPADETLEVIALLKKAIAYYTISRSVSKLPVRITDAGFTINMAIATDEINSQRQQATAGQLDLLMSSCQNDGDIYIKKAKDFLDATASDDLFPLYKASSFYTAPVAPVAPVAILQKNDGRKNLYM